MRQAACFGGMGCCDLRTGVLAYHHILSTALYLYTCALAITKVHKENVGPCPLKGKFSESVVPRRTGSFRAASPRGPVLPESDVRMNTE
jgi:hypothetical protein